MTSRPPIITRFFDAIAEAIYSHGLLTVCQLLVVVAMTLCSHEVFLEVFPDIMDPSQKNIAAWIMAIVWDITLLMTTTHTKYLSEVLPWIVSIACGVLVLFFVDAFDFSQPLIVIVRRWFVGILLMVTNFIYTRLFHRRYLERLAQAMLPRKLDETDRALKETQSRLDESERKRIQSDANLVEARAQLKERDRDLKQLHSKLKEYEADRTCEWCKTVLSNPRSLNAHKGHCEMNPKKLNGARV